MPQQPSAKVIADSISLEGHRLTTFEVVMHRFVLAEFNTHRVFSRNSASSRAIPLRKQLERVHSDPAAPVKWAAEKPGMQGGDEVPSAGEARRQWRIARDRSMQSAETLGDLGVHKSICNRLLEPFMWHTVVVTATAWENFFRQRCSLLAQPEIRAAAEAMRAAYEDSKPEPLEEYQWHLPYVSNDGETIVEVTSMEPNGMDCLKRISAARCARVSYLTQDGRRDYHEDLALYDRLVTSDPMHASPLEHVATPVTWNAKRHKVTVDGDSQLESCVIHLELPVIGNFIGWMQHRFEVEASQGRQSFS